MNGQFVSADQVSISVADTGFIMGVTVAEQLRTFAGKVFLLAEHLQRLRRSLEIVQVNPGFTDGQLSDAVQRLAQHNHALQCAPVNDTSNGGDIGINIFVTPGLYSTMSTRADTGPTVGIVTYPLPFHRWSDHYETGAALRTATPRQVPNTCWPAELKCRSRMHYFLAGREIRAKYPSAQPLLLDQDGNVSETPIANVIAFIENEGLVSPPRDAILPGISLAYLESLAAQLGVPMRFRQLSSSDLRRSQEVLLTSTPFCLQPVVEIDGEPVGAGRPGPIYSKLLGTWSDSVGVDILLQARQSAKQFGERS